MRRWAAAALFLAAGLSGCGERAEAPAAAALETERRIAQGPIIGLRAANGAQVWRGLPYAAAPIGALRWRAPRPAPTWDDRREALAFGARCAQRATGFDADEGFEPGQAIGAEDCLTVDVYAPGSARPGEKRPVMLWIHGGGNVWGRASQFDGSALAETENVVVIAAQYRLGPFGWFAHPALRQSAEIDADQAANFALLDLIAALRWTRDNVAAFGGDPDRVTIFGESAGGRNVAGLLASPLAEGLFHRAVIQSGAFESASLAEAEGAEGGLANPAPAIAQALGVEDAAALRALPAERLLAAYGGGPGFFDLPQMIEDGVTLEAPLRAAFATPDGFHRVPILIGANRDETKLFMAGDPALVVRRLWAFPTPRDPEYYDAMAGYLSRVWRIRSVHEPAAMMRAAGHEAVYAYRFDWDDGGSFLWTDTRRLLGAAHALELPFLFGDFQQLGSISDTLFTAETLPERERLSGAMGAYWAAFARDGAPGAAGGRDWPRYGAGARFLRLDVESDRGLEVLDGADTLQALIKDLKADPRLDDADRCRIVGALPAWRFAAPIAETVRAATACP